MKKTTIIYTFLISTLLLASCETYMSKKFIGLQLYSLKDLMKENPDSTIKALAEVGYKFVEAAGYRDGKFYGMEPREFERLVEENQMAFLGSHVRKDLPDSANWENTMQWWDKAIAAHKEAGVEYIVQPSMGKEGYESLEGLKKYCEYFEAIGEKCNEAGLRFGYHNHAREFQELEGEIIYDYMLQNTDPAKVMFQMDLYWVVEGKADPVKYFEKYPGRFWLWHVKDEKEVGASGEIDFERIWQYNDIAGVKYYIVEQEDHSFPPLESVKKSLEFLEEAEYVE